MKKHNAAFTLAEVLVTLMIIGVIAAMTIPTLNQNIGDNQSVAGCLKAYSVLQQAVNRLKPDFGPVGFGTKWNNSGEFWNAFVQNVNAVKVCSKDNGSECFAQKDYKKPDGSVWTVTESYSLIFADGMILNYINTDHDGGSYGLSEEDTKNLLARFVVDINGRKGPNMIGRDGFLFYLVKGKGIVPGYTEERIIKEKKLHRLD